MLSMYYYPNDMQDNPITEQQHREFYEKDHVTGAFARYFCDSIFLIVLCLPAFRKDISGKGKYVYRNTDIMAIKH